MNWVEYILVWVEWIVGTLLPKIHGIPPRPERGKDVPGCPNKSTGT